jgi:hypothetical protein
MYTILLDAFVHHKNKHRNCAKSVLSVELQMADV